MADCNALVSKVWPLATAPNSRTLKIPCGFLGLGDPAKAAGEQAKAPPASQVPRKRRRLSLDFMKLSLTVGVLACGMRNCGCEPSPPRLYYPCPGCKIEDLGVVSYLGLGSRYQLSQELALTI